MARRARPADAWLSVVKLLDGARAGGRRSRSALSVPEREGRARRHRRHARRDACRQDRGARELPCPWLVRERVSASVESAAASAQADGPSRNAHTRAAEQSPGTHLRAHGRSAHADGSDPSHCADQIRGHRCAGKSFDEHRHLRRAQVSPIPHPDQPFFISRPIFVHRPSFDAWPELCRRLCETRSHTR